MDKNVRLIFEISTQIYETDIRILVLIIGTVTQLIIHINNNLTVISEFTGCYCTKFMVATFLSKGYHKMSIDCNSITDKVEGDLRLALWLSINPSIQQISFPQIFLCD